VKPGSIFSLTCLLSSSVPLEARYVPQSVRNYLMNNGQVEQYRFDFKGESKSFDSLSSLAFSLTVSNLDLTFILIIFRVLFARLAKKRVKDYSCFQ
jgi:hypothetical protein